MKIAVATDDFTTVTGHVGRCNGFLIFEVESGEVKSKEERENAFTHHKQSGGEHKHDHSHGHGHSALAEGLKDCQKLICRGAGWRLVNDLNEIGVEVLLTKEELAEEAAIKLEKGELVVDENLKCHSH